MQTYRESIVIDGPPFSGKTTLANKLSGVTGISVKKNDLYTHLTKQQLLKSYLHDFVGHGPLILDCQWIAEYLQVPIMHGHPSRFSQIPLDLFWRIHEALGVAIILCLPPWRLIEKSCIACHFPTELLEKTKQIYLAYETFFKAHSNQRILIQYDYEFGSGTYILHSLLKTVHRIQSFTYFSPPYISRELREIS